MSGTPPDPSRRRFFRRFAGDVLASAGQVAGVLEQLRDDSAREAAALLGEPISAGEPVRVSPSLGPTPTAAAGFRTPFRFAPDDDAVLLLIDQRLLPDRLDEMRVRSAHEAAWAIRDGVVRGAPAIGQVAAIGLALSGRLAASARPYPRRAILQGAANALHNARPSAANLRWAVDRVFARYEALGDLSEDGEAIAAAMMDEAMTIVFEATTDHGVLAEEGLRLLPRPDGRPIEILTHGDTGPLASGQFGTALGIVQAAHHADIPIHVWVGESRPDLSGGRLAAWELRQAGVPHTLIADAAAGHVLARRPVDVVLVGAERVAGNGDTVAQVGTYPLAVLARRHGIPFYVCAPLSSVDVSHVDGASIEVEERPSTELVQFRGVRVAPDGTEAFDPPVDITPAELVTGIVTEEGVVVPPFGEGLRTALERRAARRKAAGWITSGASPTTPLPGSVPTTTADGAPAG